MLRLKSKNVKHASYLISHTYMLENVKEIRVLFLKDYGRV